MIGHRSDSASGTRTIVAIGAGGDSSLGDGDFIIFYTGSMTEGPTVLSRDLKEILSGFYGSGIRTGLIEVNLDGGKVDKEVVEV